MVSATEKLKKLLLETRNANNANLKQNNKNSFTKKSKKLEINKVNLNKNDEIKKNDKKEIENKIIENKKIETNKISVEKKSTINNFENFDDIETFLSKENRFSDELNKHLTEKISGNILIHCDASNNKDILVAVIKKSIKEGKKPILILTSDNYRSMSKFLTKSKISINDLYLIDTVSKNLVNVDSFDKIILVDSLRNLTQLQIKLLKILRAENDSIIIFDTVDVLELYHSPKVILKFIYSILKIAQKKHSQGVILVNNLALAPKLSQLFNDFVEIKKIE